MYVRNCNSLSLCMYFVGNKKRYVSEHYRTAPVDPFKPEEKHELSNKEPLSAFSEGATSKGQYTCITCMYSNTYICTYIRMYSMYQINQHLVHHKSCVLDNLFENQLGSILRNTILKYIQFLIKRVGINLCYKK